MVYGMCQAYQALPESGGVMDQPVWVLQMHAILSEGGHFDKQRETPAAGSGDPWASIPMETL